MIIEVVIFFIWVILFLVMGGGVAMSVRKKQGRITRRFWNRFLIGLCLAIFVPLVFHWVHIAAQREAHRESVEQKPVNGGTGPSSPSGGAVPPGDSARPGSVIPGAAPANNTGVKDTTAKPLHR
jgi:hypothetical protein